jgi:hypothetical protein
MKNPITPSYSNKTKKTFKFQYINNWDCVEYITASSFNSALLKANNKINGYEPTDWKQVTLDIGPRMFSNDPAEFDKLAFMFETPDDIKN